MLTDGPLKGSIFSMETYVGSGVYATPPLIFIPPAFVGHTPLPDLSFKVHHGWMEQLGWYYRVYMDDVEARYRWDDKARPYHKEFHEW